MNSVLLAEGRGNLHSRDFLCCLNREQRGREAERQRGKQAMQQLKRVKIRETLTNRKRQNDSTYSSKSLKLFCFLTLRM